MKAELLYNLSKRHQQGGTIPVGTDTVDDGEGVRSLHSVTIHMPTLRPLEHQTLLWIVAEEAKSLVRNFGMKLYEVLVRRLSSMAMIVPFCWQTLSQGKPLHHR